ncbi:MAG: GIY-YIG nuclease family protein [Rhodoferax sp.]|nr:GIY-YIG nuclease family protein [Rhodoferax sp.]
MTVQFEPTNSFCYNFSRYQVLPAIIAMQELQSGQPFRLVELVKKITDLHLTPEQQATIYQRAQTGKPASVINTIKWYVPFIAKNTKQLTPMGEGMYRLPDAIDIEEVEAQAEDEALEDDVSEASVSEGYIYAFSFPALIKPQGDFPIKIGMTVNDVQQRVASQCKGSAIFDNPKVLDSWRVNRVGFVESAIHKVLAARGKWREGVPGTEWFDTTVGEIKAIIDFTGALHR